MARQEVEFYEAPRIEFTDVIQPRKYTFRPIGKPGRKSKQQRAFDYLKRTGAVQQAVRRVAVGEVTRHRFDTRDFVEVLFRQKAYLFHDFNLEGRTLLIGAEDFAEMMYNIRVHRPESFMADFARSENGRTKLLGFTVQIIPWMRGFLVMP